MPSQSPVNNRWLLAGALLVARVTFAVFITCQGNQFVDFDDLNYLPIGSYQKQLNLQTLLWACSSFPGANWHPLTMLSLVIDARIWGDDPFGFHLTNIILHCCSVFLACFLFARLISIAQHHAAAERYQQKGLLDSRLVIFASLVGALFFGLHPLRVESVVWASERKDVLCLLWIISALLCYLHYCRIRSDKPSGRFWQMPTYWLVWLMTGLALLSKPLAVSLPLVFLVLDWYPLARLRHGNELRAVLGEKLPLLLLSVIAVVMTLLAQRAALSRAPNIEIFSRMLVAGKALFFYFGKTLWPADLSALYPHPGNVAASVLPEYIFYAGTAAAVSLLVVAAGRLSRLWPAFWMFYLLTLAPMLGIVQVGAQWVADRYSYLPSLGIALLWGYGAARLVRLLLHNGKGGWAVIAASLAVLQIVLLAWLTLLQIPVWRTTESLMTRMISRMPLHPEAPYYTRAKYRNETGAYAEALADIDMTLSIALQHRQNKKYPEIYIAKAHILSNLGRLNEALANANLALETSAVEPPPAYVAFRDRLSSLLAAGRSGF